MKTTYAALVVLASGASASFFDSSKFSCPSNTDNECNPQQSTGFDWAGLDLGGFESYGDFSFSGWSCAGSFGSGKKRDILTGRTFQDKCITGHASRDKASSPSFGCGSSPSVKDFSVAEFHVSVEFDCELEFHYEMPDKSTCKQKSSCSKGGSVVKNTQCGGAQSVTVVYPAQNEGIGATKDTCAVGVHSIAFDCNPASATKVLSPSTTSSAASSTSSVNIPETTPVLTTSSAFVRFFNSSSRVFVPSFSAPVTIGSEILTTPVVSSPVVEIITSVLSSSAPVTISSEILTTPVISSPVVEIVTSVPSSSAPVTISSEILITPVVSSLLVEITSAPVKPVSVTSNTPVDVVTVIVSTFTTVCPVTLTHGTGVNTRLEIGTKTSTIVKTVTYTVCTKCSAPEVTNSANSAISTIPSSPGPVKNAPCPDVLPSCLNTWLFSEGCSSNTDHDCYCPSASFVKNVFDCLSAHASDDNEIAEAQTYFQGICAPHIPSNPAIVTGATAVLVQTAVPTVTPVPVTTIEIFTTLTVPCVESTGTLSGSIIPSSSITTLLSTYLTVPQVIFITVNGTSTQSAALVAGTPASNPAITTPAVGFSILPIPTAVGTLSSVSRTGAGNLTATATPTNLPVSTGSGARNTFTFGSAFGALLIAVMAL